MEGISSHRLCECCLSVENSNRLSDETKNQINLSFCIQVASDLPTENVPTFICAECELKVNDSFKFRCQILKSQDKLKTMRESINFSGILKDNANSQSFYSEYSLEVKEELLSDLDDIEDVNDITAENQNKIVTEDIENNITNETFECDKQQEVCLDIALEKGVLLNESGIMEVESPEIDDTEYSDNFTEIRQKNNSKFNVCIINNTPECDITKKVYVNPELEESPLLNVSEIINEQNQTTSLALELNEKILVCDNCNEGFVTRQLLESHLIAHHQHFVCDLCLKSFVRKNKLIKHIKSHNIEMKASCIVCKKKVSNISSLISHEKMHFTLGIENGFCSLSESTKYAVRHLFDKGFREPNLIKAAFRNCNRDEPNEFMLNNFLSMLQIEKLALNTHYASEMFDWCNKNMEIPNEDDKPFILSVNFQTNGLSDVTPNIKFVMSTKRLLQYVNKIEGVHVNTSNTWKWHNYSVLSVGSSDMDQVYHPFAVAVYNHETEYDFEFIFNSIKKANYKIHNQIWKPRILLANVNNEITNGFQNVFGYPTQRLICYTDVLEDIERINDFHSISELKKDIETLHLSINSDVFNFASKLFLDKWYDMLSVSKIAFMKNFQKMWFETNCNWYVGASKILSSNNAYLLSSKEMFFKGHEAGNQQPHIKQFFKILLSDIMKWSKKCNPRNPIYRPLASKATCSFNLWVLAYQWTRKKIVILEEERKNQIIFYFSSPHVRREITKTALEIYQNSYLNWKSFNEYYYGYVNNIWKVTVDLNEDSTASCSCPIFLKNNICMHSVGVLIHMGKIKVPFEVLNRKCKPKVVCIRK